MSLPHPPFDLLSLADVLEVAESIVPDLNGADLTMAVDDAEAMVVSAAAGDLDVPDLSRLIAAHLG